MLAFAVVSGVHQMTKSDVPAAPVSLAEHRGIAGVAQSFDNRARSEAVGTKIRALPIVRLRYGEHFKFEVAGKTIVYCYIRKNGSSAFKRMLCNESPYRDRLGKYACEFDFLRAYHLVGRNRKIEEADHVIFVYRDPVERAQSLFRSKFVIGEGNGDIFDNYRRITGCAPETSTFDDFVLKYLTANSRSLDPHCRSQYSHLRPVRYTDAIPLASLRSEISRIVGDEMAERYFSKKTNSSTPQDSHGMPHAGERGKEVVGTLRKIYRDDYAMITESLQCPTEQCASSARDCSIEPSEPFGRVRIG